MKRDEKAAVQIIGTLESVIAELRSPKNRVIAVDLLIEQGLQESPTAFSTVKYEADGGRVYTLTFRTVPA